MVSSRFAQFEVIRHFTANKEKSSQGKFSIIMPHNVSVRVAEEGLQECSHLISLPNQKPSSNIRNGVGAKVKILPFFTECNKAGFIWTLTLTKHFFTA